MSEHTDPIWSLIIWACLTTFILCTLAYVISDRIVATLAWIDRDNAETDAQAAADHDEPSREQILADMGRARVRGVSARGHRQPPRWRCSMSPHQDEADELRDAMREALLSAMREWSEEEWCAGWLIDLEERLHRQGGKWETLGRAVGWPVGCEAEGGWETWEDAAARYESADWKASRPWLRTPSNGGAA